MTDEKDDLSTRIESLLRAVGHEMPDARPESFGFAAEFPKVDRVKRKSFTRTEQLAIFQRDRFIDRYTGERLFYPGVLLLLGQLFPKAFPRPESNEGWRTGKCHWIYWRLWPTLDHVVPVARGGHPTDEANLVTTSQVINTAKSVWTAEEAPPAIRFTPRPLEDIQAQTWDGMLGWYVGYYKQHKSILMGDRDLEGWHKAAEHRLRGLITRDSPPDAYQWNDDDFNLDSHGVEAPLKERLELLARDGFRPEDVSDDIRERYRQYLERKRKQD